MKELIRAKEIYEAVQKLDYQIAEINDCLNAAISAGQEYLLSCARKKGSTSAPSEPRIMGFTGGFEGLFAQLRKMDDGLATEISNNDELHVELTDTELVIMFSALLDYKKARRQHLVEEFDQLNISLKL